MNTKVHPDALRTVAFRIGGSPYYRLDWDAQAYERNGVYGRHLLQVFFSSQDRKVWACFFDETPSAETLKPYHGASCDWGFAGTGHSYYVHPLGESSRVEGCITRNGERFYPISAPTLVEALRKAVSCLDALRALPFPVHSRNWEKHLLDRRVWYREQAGVIRAVEIGEVYVVPERGTFKPPPPPFDEDWPDSYVHGLHVDLLSPHILWERA